MSKTKKIAILAIIAMVLTMMPAALFAVDIDSDRLAGADRIGTALAIAEAGWDSADTVILAPADQANLVDALAAAPLAGQENAPILLTFKGSLNADVKAAIADLGAKKVYAVGAVSDAVVAEVDAIDGVSVEKLAGASRWATAEAINAKLTKPAGTFVVGYNAIADAMSAASFAAANGYAIVLANADGSVDEDALLGDTTYIVGGTTWVKDIAGAERLAGADRFATNVAVAEGLDFDFGKVYVANGMSLVDALAVAPLAAMDDAFVLLVSATKGEAVEGMTASTQIIAVGGTNAVPNKVIDGLFGEDDGEFTVKSAKAPNLVQVVLTLSNSNYYDKDELTTADNYEFKGDKQGDSRNKAVEIEVDKASLSGNTVTLTLKEAVENQSEGSLVIDSAVTGKELKFDEIEFFDSSIPEIEDVKVIGKNVIKFNFSEPINFEPNASDIADSKFKKEFKFSLDGKSYGVDEIKVIKAGKEANVKVYGALKEGTLEVKVGNGLEDYAGFNVIANTYEVDVVEDTEAPYVTDYKDAKNGAVTLVFNEDIQHESEKLKDFYHTNTNNIIGPKDVDKDDPFDADYAKIDGNELTLKFVENELPDGTSYVYISTGAVADLWDNENNSIKVAIEIEEDNIKPEVKKVEYNSNNEIVITFTEEVKEDTAEKSDNYTLVDEDGDDVRFRTPDRDSTGKKVTLELRESNPDKGTYDLTIEKVEDLAGNKIDKVTFEVVIGNTEAPEFPDTVYYSLDTIKDVLKLYIPFDEAMAVDGSYSVADLYKYDLDLDGGANSWINLGKANADDDYDIDIEVTDNDKTVEITIEDFDGTFSQSSDVRIARVADADGNVTTSASVIITHNGSTYYIYDVNGAPGIEIDTVKATDNVTLEVKFKGNFDHFDIEDFYIADSTGAAIAGYELADLDVKKDNEIIITLDDGQKMPANAAGLYLATLDDDSNGSIRSNETGTIETENSYGIKLADDQLVSITDKIKPGVKKEDGKDPNNYYDGNSGTKKGIAAVYATYDESAGYTGAPSGYDDGVSKITVVFNEALKEISQYMVEVNDGDNDVIAVTHSAGSDTLVIYVEGEVIKGDNIDISAIYDNVEGNVTKDLTLKIEYKVKEDPGTITGL